MTCALLLDLDGTLVDSDREHLAAFQTVFAPQGVSLDRETYAQKIMGASNEAIGQAFLAHLTPHEREAALATAREEADQVRASAETEMRWARAAEESAASDRSARLAIDVARKLVARLPDSARVDGFIDGLARALASLPEASRDGFGAGERARLIAPRPLTAAELQAAHDAFARALGRPVDFAVVVEPAVIAGLEIETPHAVVRNSFRQDLKRIVEELTRHDGVHR